MPPVISVENLSKKYRLGLIGGGTLRADFKRWWAKTRGKPDPLLRIGQEEYGNVEGETIWALRDISFQVSQGEVLGIIGRNGAGKSTLLKVLSRITAPTSGVVKVKGRVGSLLEVGTGFHPELTGRENIIMNGTILGMKRREIQRKFDEIVDFSGVEQFIDTPVKRYSSGMYVRLAFAVAAHLEPEILLVDEVLAVGDAEFQKKCLGKMGEVAGEGRTVLFVSHNMAAIQNICMTSYLLDQGRIVASGETSQVVSKYLKSRSGRDNYKDLEDREDRSGTGVMRFTQVKLLNQKGESLYMAQTGSHLSIKLNYASKEVSEMPAIIHLTFFDINDQRLFFCLSRNSHPKVERLSERGSIICHFPKIPLLPGNYHVNLRCKIGEVIADEIQNAFSFDVTIGDFFKTGKMNKNLKNGLLVDHYWQFS